MRGALTCSHSALHSLLSILLGLVFFPADVVAQQTVTVDFSTVIGTAGDPVATGFRGTWWDSIPDSLITPIKPVAVGAPTGLEGSGDEESTVWDRAATLGTTVEWNIMDGFGFYHGTHWNSASCDSCDIHNLSAEECYDLRLQEWADHVSEIIAHGEQDRVVGSLTVPLVYDIWNEPDGKLDWDPAPCYGPPDSLFFDMWKTARDSIHAHGGLVAGPSFGGGVVGLTGQSSSGIDLDILLDFWSDQDTWPDIFAWHHIANSDFTAQDAEDPLALNLLDQVLYAKQQLAGAGADTAAMRYAVSEMLSWDTFMIPGVLVRNFALAERARPEGLLYVGRTHWCIDPTQPRVDTTRCNPDSGGLNWCYGCETVDGIYWPLQWTRLGGLVVPYGPDQWQTRHTWWAYKAYADLEGSYVTVQGTSTVDLLAAFDPSESVGRVLVGNYDVESGSPLLLNLQNIPASLIINDAVRVRVERLRGHPDALYLSGVAPIEVVERNFVVDDGTVSVEIDATDFGGGDALIVSIRPFTPTTTIAPG